MTNASNLIVDGSVSGALVNDGTLTANAGSQLSELTNNLTANVSGDVTGTVQNIAPGVLTYGGTTTTGGAITNAGQLIVDTGAQLTASSGVTSSADLDVNGTLIGNVSVTGGTADVANGASVTGNVTNNATLTTQAGSSISGQVTNTANASLGGSAGSVDNDGTMAIQSTGSVTGAVDNSGTLTNVAGNIGSLANSGTATVAGVDVGTTTNTGAAAVLNTVDTNFTANVTNSGTFNTSGSTTIAGDLLNNLTMNGDGGSSLGVTGAFTNNGTINRSGAGNYTITATNINLGAASVVNGGVILNGNVNNAGDVIIDVDTDVLGDLTVLAGGSLTASATGDFNGNNLTNQDTVDVNAGGSLINIDVFNNSGTTTLDAGTSLLANTIINQVGGDITSAGTLGGAITNNAALTVSGGINGTLTNAATGTATINGTTTSTGDIANAGNMTVNAGTTLTVPTLTNQTGGSLTATGAISGNLVGATGATNTTSTGGVVGNVTNDSVMSLAGTVTGAVANLTNGVLTTAGNGNFASFANSGTSASISAGDTVTVVGGTTNTAGQLSVNGTLNSSVNSTGGTVNVNTGGVIAGPVTNAGNLTFAGGTVNGNVTSSNILNVSTSGTIDGTLNNAAGATATVNAGQTLTVSSLTTNNGTLNVVGNFGGNILNAGDLALADGLLGDLASTSGTATVTGAITGNVAVSGGTFNANGSTTIGGDLAATGGAFNMNGSTTVAGTATFNTTTAVGAGNTLTASNTILTNGAVLGLDGTLASPLQLQAGSILNFGGAILGDVSGGGRIEVGSGVRSITGNLDGSAMNLGFTLSLEDGAGGTTQGNSIALSGALTGDYIVNVTLTSLDFGSQTEDIKLIDVSDVAGSNYDFSFGAVTFDPSITTDPDTVFADPSGQDTLSPFLGEFIYTLERSTTAGSEGDLVLVDRINPGISGLAGNIALTQSLIGTVINRPTSPFVSGLAVPTEDKCGPGVWSRANAGQADAEGSTVSSNGTDDSEISATYYGAQFGADIGCYQGHFNEWDLSFGVFAGFNEGNGSQPIFVQDGSGNDLLISTTDTSLSQRYGGLYMTAARGNFTADLQIRSETTEFTVDNPQLELNNTTFDVNGTTFSGAISYSFVPENSNGWRIVPTAGFSITENSTDLISFGDDTAPSTLSVDDHTSQVAFLGATAARVQIAEDGLSANNYFITGTYYKDFSDDLTSSFTVGGTGRTENLASENLGDYGEISAGWNYIKILEQGPGERAARQFNASIRADARFSGNLDSIGITGQVRWQF